MIGPNVYEVIETIKAVSAPRSILTQFTDDYGHTLLAVHWMTLECALFGCAIHNPTDERGWPLRWNNLLYLFMRVCPCGVEHPDRDEVAWRRRNGVAYDWSQHTCCGHCAHV